LTQTIEIKLQLIPTKNAGEFYRKDLEACNLSDADGVKEPKLKTTRMEIEAIAVMIPIISIIGVIVMVIYLRRYQNEERMAMIDKGIDPAVFTTKAKNTSGALRASLLLIGAGIGLLLGYALDRSFDMEQVGYFSMLLIFGGTGLGLAYMIEEKKIKEGN
jgi:hypothetical protein